MFIDTHCHIHDRDTYDFVISNQKNPPEEDYVPEKILKRAHKYNVRKVIVVGTSEKDSLAARNFALTHKDTYWSWGVHPDEAGNGHITSSGPAEVTTEQERAAPVTTGGGDACRGSNVPFPAPVAIGEVGLDYRNGKSASVAQIDLLKQMIDLAQKNDLPIIFHVRDAFDDFWPIVDELNVDRAVIHSFSDSEKNLEIALDHGFYIGVNGLATFADLPTPPLEKTLLETDAPFLAPVPVRGRVNEPAYIPDIAKFLAEKHQTTVEEIAKITTKNAKDLFKI